MGALIIAEKICSVKDTLLIMRETCPHYHPASAFDDMDLNRREQNGFF
jgi:hypothetical protein